MGRRGDTGEPGASEDARATSMVRRRRSERDAIDPGIGQPDFRAPEHIVQTGVPALRDGYTPVNGLPALRDAVIAATAPPSIPTAW